MSQSEPERAGQRARESQREPDSEPERARVSQREPKSEPERARESQRESQREPDSEPERARVSFCNGTVETDALRLHWECTSGCGLIYKPNLFETKHRQSYDKQEQKQIPSIH